MLLWYTFACHHLTPHRAGANISNDAASVRGLLTRISNTQLGAAEREAGRTEVLPVQWRKNLMLKVAFVPCPVPVLHYRLATRDSLRTNRTRASQEDSLHTHMFPH